MSVNRADLELKRESFDPIFTDEFFKVPVQTEEKNEPIDFPLPPGETEEKFAEELEAFLKSEDGKKFRTGVSTIVNEIKTTIGKWDVAEAKKKLWFDHLDNFFNKRFLNYEGLSKLHNEKQKSLFTEGVIYLNNLSQKIKDETLPFSLRHSAISNLLDKDELERCGPGTTEFIKESYDLLITNPSEVLAVARREIAKQLANKTHRSLDEKAADHAVGLEIHYANYFIFSYAHLLGLKEIWDPYFNNLQPRKVEDLFSACIKTLPSSLILENILSHLVKKFDLLALHKDLQDQLEKFKLETNDPTLIFTSYYELQTAKLKESLDKYGLDEDWVVGSCFELEYTDEGSMKVSLQPDAQKTLEISLINRLFNKCYLNQNQRIEIPLKSGVSLYLLLGENNVGLSYIKNFQKYTTFSAYYQELNEAQKKEAVEELIQKAKEFSQEQRESIIQLLADKSEDFYLQCLKEKIIDPTTKNYAGLTPILFAAHKGYLDVVKYLVNETKETLDQTYKNGSKAIHLAAESGHVNIIKYLINECSVLFDKPNDEGKTPLSFAAYKGHADAVKYLIEMNAVIIAPYLAYPTVWKALLSKLTPNQLAETLLLKEKGFSGFEYAASSIKDIEIWKELLARLDPSKLAEVLLLKNDKGNSGFEYAAEHIKDPAIWKELLARLDPSKLAETLFLKNNAGFSGFHAAAWFIKDPGIWQELLAKLDPSKLAEALLLKADNGSSGFESAGHIKDPTIWKKLLARLDNSSVLAKALLLKNNAGFSGFQTAAWFIKDPGIWQELLAKLDPSKLAEALLLKNNAGYSGFQFAAQFIKDPAIWQELLAQLDPSMLAEVLLLKNDQGFPGFQSAAEYIKEPAIWKELLARLDPNKLAETLLLKNNAGNSGFQFAAEHIKDPAIWKELLARLDPSKLAETLLLKNNAGHSGFQFAAQFIKDPAIWQELLAQLDPSKLAEVLLLKNDQGFPGFQFAAQYIKEPAIWKELLARLDPSKLAETLLLKNNAGYSGFQFAAQLIKDPAIWQELLAQLDPSKLAEALLLKNDNGSSGFEYAVECIKEPAIWKELLARLDPSKLAETLLLKNNNGYSGFQFAAEHIKDPAIWKELLARLDPSKLAEALLLKNNNGYSGFESAVHNIKDPTIWKELLVRLDPSKLVEVLLLKNSSEFSGFQIAAQFIKDPTIWKELLARLDSNKLLEVLISNHYSKHSGFRLATEFIKDPAIWKELLARLEPNHLAEILLFKKTKKLTWSGFQSAAEFIKDPAIWKELLTRLEPSKLAEILLSKAYLCTNFQTAIQRINDSTIWQELLERLGPDKLAEALILNQHYVSGCDYVARYTRDSALAKTFFFANPRYSDWYCVAHWQSKNEYNYPLKAEITTWIKYMESPIRSISNTPEPFLTFLEEAIPNELNKITNPKIWKDLLNRTLTVKLDITTQDKLNVLLIRTQLALANLETNDKKSAEKHLTLQKTISAINDISSCSASDSFLIANELSTNNKNQLLTLKHLNNAAEKGNQTAKTVLTHILNGKDYNEACIECGLADLLQTIKTTTLGVFKQDYPVSLKKLVTDLQNSKNYSDKKLMITEYIKNPEAAKLTEINTRLSDISESIDKVIAERPISLDIEINLVEERKRSA